MLSREMAPLYQQLRELLVEKIESGEWEPGRQLPTEKEISTEYGVSRATVRQAMQFLQNQGLIERFQGKGTYVGRPKVATNLMLLFSPMRGMTGTNSEPLLRVDSVSRVRPSGTVAARLGVGSQEEVYEVRRTVVADGEPLMLIRNWLVARHFPGFEEHFSTEGTVMQTLLRRYGLEGVRQYKEVEVAILDEDEAVSLRSQAGAPALLLTYLTSTMSGEVFEFRRVLVRGDRCKYFIEQEQSEFLV